MYQEPAGDVRKGLAGALALCLAIFFADASWSAAIPTFPSYAKSLGSSLTIIGLLASASSVSTLLASIPLGSLSDRIGRRRIMLLGMACFVATPLAYTFSSSPLHLFPARILLGVAMGSTFSIGFIYVTELAESINRNLAQGLYMTAMGMGFTLGPLAGGITAKLWGYTTSFYLSSVLGAAALLIMFFAPEAGSRNGNGSEKTVKKGALEGFRGVLVNPRILAAGLANFFSSMLFNAVITFFPLYGNAIGFDEFQVGVGLTVRGLSSTVSRFPTGAAASRMGALRLIMIGLVASAATLIALPFFDDFIVIGVLLGIQGLAYGVYLTSGNVYVAQEAPEHQRGTAMGVYSTFANVSGIISPMLLGAVAEAWGFTGAFQVSGFLALAGTIITILTAGRKRK